MRTLKREQAERIWEIMCESHDLRTILAHEGIDTNISEEGSLKFRGLDMHEAQARLLGLDQKAKKPISQEKRQRAVGMFQYPEESGSGADHFGGRPALKSGHGPAAILPMARPGRATADQQEDEMQTVELNGITINEAQLIVLNEKMKEAKTLYGSDLGAGAFFVVRRDEVTRCFDISLWGCRKMDERTTRLHEDEVRVMIRRLHAAIGEV